MKAHPSRLGPQYAPQIAELEKMCFDQPWSEEQCRQAFAQPAYAAFGMPGADILLAYISLYLVRDEMEVLNLAVRPECRRQGIMHGMLERAPQAGAWTPAAFSGLASRAQNRYSESLPGSAGEQLPRHQSL